MGLVEGHAHVLVVQLPHVDLVVEKLLDRLVSVVNIHLDGVKNHVIVYLVAYLLDSCLEDLSQPIHLVGNLVQPLGSVIDRVHRRDIG